MAQVWFTDLDEREDEPAQLSILSITEQISAARLKSQIERRRFIAGRAFTRRLLGGITGIPPVSLEFCKDRCGKPRLSVPIEARDSRLWSSLDFNVSHSENILGVAVGLACVVGIDVEVLDPNLDALSIAEANLEQPDIDLIRSSSIADRALVFYHIWTRREAFAKMQGHGVTSDHVHCRTDVPSSMRSFEFAIGKKEIVCSLSLANRKSLRQTQ